MDFIVISDLHLGSKYCRAESFLSLLKVLPGDCPLILNGDIIDHWHHSMPASHEQALRAIKNEAQRREVIWVRGNNDLRYRPADAGPIQFVSEYVINEKVYIAHGHSFDCVMHNNILFTWPFKLMHFLRVSFGARPMHVAEYAKRWGWLYWMLRNHVMRNTVKYAQKKGYSTVISGHTHYVDDTQVHNVRYVNTGAWTEDPLCCAVSNGDGLKLLQFDADTGTLQELSTNRNGIGK